MIKLLTVFLLATLFVCCSSDNEDIGGGGANNLIGTKWTAQDDIAEFIYGKTCTTTIEFLDKNNCQEINIRKGMKIGAGTFTESGTYTIKGDSVIWTVDKRTIGGKVTGSTMTTTMKTISAGQRVYLKD